jgi:DNA-binding beta-propeller fold protein YncE
MGVFVDNKRKELYVADSGRNEVLIFDLKGSPVFKFGAVNGVANPFDLVVRDGLIYLVQEGKAYIEVFNYRGEAVRRVAPPEGITFSPGRMAMDEDGSLYVVNKARTTCMVFDSQDRFVGTIGTGLTSLAGVAVSKDRIYLITPFGGRAVHVYDKKGNFIMAFEGLQDQGGTLGLPTSVTIDKNGLLWLVDSLRGIVVYDPGGKEVVRFNEYGETKGQLFFPVDIDFDKGNIVYISEKGAKRISVFKRER